MLQLNNFWQHLFLFEMWSFCHWTVCKRSVYCWYRSVFKEMEILKRILFRILFWISSKASRAHTCPFSKENKCYGCITFSKIIITGGECQFRVEVEITVFIDRDTGGIIRLVASVCPSICPSISASVRSSVTALMVEQVCQWAAQAPTRCRADTYLQNFWHPWGQHTGQGTEVASTLGCFHLFRHGTATNLISVGFLQISAY